jgi:GntR family transcriptional repressor for pyruvate dehydrogenase complex
MMKPIKKKKRLYHEIIERLLEFIEKDELKPGDKIPSERFLAEALGVSRTTVKEAISVLESKKLVEIKPGVGVFLSTNTKQHIQEQIQFILEDQKIDLFQLLELRQAIEGDAAFYAAQRMTEEQKVRFHEYYRKLIAAEEKGEAAIEEDLRFHLAILEASNNLLMNEVMNLISDKMRVILTQNRYKTIQVSKDNDEVIKEHQAIYEAIVNRKPDLARQEMWNHLNSIKSRHS